MDRPAAFAILAAIPVLAVVFYVSTQILHPFWGYGAALAFYWVFVLLPWIIWRGGFHKARFALVPPSRLLTLANIVPVLAVAGAAALALSQNMIPAVAFLAVAIAALANGTLEEVFWRGTLLQDDASQQAQIGQIALFTSWHLALLFAGGVIITGGALGLLGGAAIGGLLWTMARMRTGTIGFGIICHIGLNLFAFTELASKNLT